MPIPPSLRAQPVVRLSLTLPPELADGLRQQAGREATSVSEILRRAVVAYLEQQKS